ncbi:MAG: TrmH family RNA methyltransferase [Actinomycetaceae bacterium]|nr:TrmH family RNA methyltransferase [Actinomycetaceae bacterium]
MVPIDDTGNSSDPSHQDTQATPPSSPPPGEIQGVGPWSEGDYPSDPHFDPQLLREGDARNVLDRYRYWTVEAIVEDLDRRLDDPPIEPSTPDAAHALGKTTTQSQKLLPRLDMAIENLGHDFNIGSVIRTANCLGVRHVHILGRKRFNRRGAMVTDRYLHMHYHPDISSLKEYAVQQHLVLCALDNLEGALPLETATIPARMILIAGEESSGITPEVARNCEMMFEITQHGSSRSMNVGAASAIAMWAWRAQNPPPQ